MLWKCCTQYASKHGKLFSGHRTGKGQFSFQVPKKGSAKEWSNYCTIALISHTSKVMLKILKARLQQYMNHELPDVQLDLEKAEELDIKLSTSIQLSTKQESSRETSISALLTMPKPYCVDHNKLWKILKQLGIPDHLTYLLRILCAGQEVRVGTGYGTTDWFQIQKGVHQDYILSPCLFNLYTEYVMRNAGLEEAQAGIKIAGRNINNLRYADDTTIMTESEEELKSLWWKWKRRVKTLT